MTSSRFITGTGGLRVVADEQVWMTTGMVARYLEVSESTVRRLVKEHGLPSHTIGRRSVRFLRGEVDRWSVRDAA